MIISVQFFRKNKRYLRAWYSLSSKKKPGLLKKMMEPHEAEATFLDTNLWEPLVAEVGLTAPSASSLPHQIQPFFARDPQ